MGEYECITPLQTKNQARIEVLMRSWCTGVHGERVCTVSRCAGALVCTVCWCAPGAGVESRVAGTVLYTSRRPSKNNQPYWLSLWLDEPKNLVIYLMGVKCTYGSGKPKN